MFENNLIAGVSGQGGRYSIEDSLRFNDDDSAYLSRTPSVAGNRKTWTWSAWVKRGNLGILSTLFGSRVATNDSQAFAIFFTGDNKLGVVPWSTSVFLSDAVFRDVSGWYHIAVVFDSTQATSTDIIKVYVNGVNQSGTYPLAITLNADYAINQAGSHRIGDWPASGFFTFDGYMAEVNFIDGQALTANSFGQIDATTGEWSPKRYAGTYGTNGFYLPFDGNANDSSGNGNNWTENNLASTDFMIDTPTNNFSTFNPLAVSTASFSQGNLNAVMSSSTPAKITSTFAVSYGKYFMEYEYKGNSNWPVGISADAIQRNYLGMSDGNTSISFWCSTSTSVYINGVLQSFSGSATTWTSGDIVGVALDADNQEVSLYKNGTLVGSSVSYSAYGWSQAFFAAGNYINGNQYISNFGADSSFAGLKTRQGNTDANGIGDFYYAPPAGGYLALCSDNLPEPAIVQPETQFNVVTYTGNGGTQSITGVGFQPDFVWAKLRTTSSYHRLHDVVRGSDNTLASNVSDAESIGNGIVSFDSDGFTMDSNTNINQSYPYVAWCWKAGGTAVTNTDGAITSQVSANVDAGFSIVSYTGTGSTATVGHGLSSAPDMIIFKGRNAVTNWGVYHSSLGATGGIFLNLTNAFTTALYFNNTSPTSSVFTVGGGVSWNNDTSSNTYIAYAFHSVEGFSKFGSYVGNGSTNGIFVYTGFKPAFVMIKCTSASGAGFDWIMHDTKRSVYNLSATQLIANSSVEENKDSGGSSTVGVGWDILSNGFKLRTSSGGRNASGGTYIYMAFAEHPFNYATGR